MPYCTSEPICNVIDQTGIRYIANDLMEFRGGPSPTIPWDDVSCLFTWSKWGDC